MATAVAAAIHHFFSMILMARKHPALKPTPRMMRLYDVYVNRWGEASDIFVFDARELAEPVNLQLIHVPVWAAHENCDVTTAVSLGMSELCMRDADYLAELHFACRMKLTEREHLGLGGLLANIAEYPFEHDRKLDWWEVISNPGRIPLFTGCRHLLLRPAFTDEGLDEIEDEDGRVKILYVVPITPYERHLLLEKGRQSLLDYVNENQVEMLANRFDGPTKQPERRDSMNFDKWLTTMKVLGHRLQEAGIPYAFVGGIALHALGHPSYTDCVEVLLRPDGLVQFNEHLVPVPYQPVAGRRQTFLEPTRDIVIRVEVTGTAPGNRRVAPLLNPDPTSVGVAVNSVMVAENRTLLEMSLAAGRARTLANAVEVIRAYHLDESFAEVLPQALRPAFLKCLNEVRCDDEVQARNA